MVENENKKIEPLFINEKYGKIVGIVSSKINMLINFPFLNGAMAKWIRKATENIWNNYNVGLSSVRD